MIGQVIGSYRVLAELGRGGMGVVYRVEHVQLGRPAALKMLLPHVATDPGIVQRFFQEARSASMIEHPGIIEIYEFGTHTDGRAYIVMALLKGETLDHRLLHGPLPPVEGATLIVQVASALAAAHARGIVHRDLKPDNIFLAANEMMPYGVQVKLLDFGIAKLADDRGGGMKTQTGMLIGTPAYMSPEQCMGSPDIDQRTDLYALGCILYHVLCGRPPFLGEQGTGMMIAAHLRDTPVDPRAINPQISAPLAAIVLRLLEKDPAARFQTAGELKQALVQAGAQGTKSGVPDAHAPASFAPTLAGPSVQTTSSGSAAQVITKSARGGSRGALWLLVGIGLAAVVGVAVFVAMSGDKPAVAPQPAVAVAPQPAVAIAPTPTPAPPPTTPAPPPTTPAPPPAPAPHPPATTPPAPPPQHLDAVALPLEVKNVAFKLGAAAYASGQTIDIAFSSPVDSKPKHQAWVTVVEAGKPPTQYGTWEYVADGARVAHLKAPTAPGAYEVRLHTDYPTKSTNVVFAQPVTIKAQAAAGQSGETPRAQQRFTLSATKLAPGATATLEFAAPLHAAKGEKFWVTVVERRAGDSAWGKYEYVPEGARALSLAVPTAAGDYEIRLHANYPTKSTNVVHRVQIHVGP